MGRIDKAIKNSIVGIISFMLITLAAFINRRIFAQVLGAQYIGLLGFFSDVLEMIALSEIGIFGVSVFYLYKPLAENDCKKINTVLNFSRKMYNWISIIVFSIGLIIMCFIDKFVNGTISMNSIRIYFLLSVLNSVASYFLFYKKILIVADQKNYIISIAHIVFKLVGIILQIGILILLKSFYLYLVIQILVTIAENYACSIIVNKKYPYVTNKEVASLDNETKKDIITRTKALFVSKIAGFIIYSTDNIIISKFINLTQVGIYANYMLIIGLIKTLFNQVFAAFTSGFGNMIAKNEKEEAFKVFNASLFFTFYAACVSSVMLTLLSKPFIKLWLGEEYVLSAPTVYMIAISLYILLIDSPAISVQNATALHDKDKKVMIIQIFVNIIASVILVKRMGIFGVVLANVLSNILLPSISKPYVIFKYVFNKSVFEYYVKYLFYAILTAGIAFITVFISSKLSVDILILQMVVDFIIGMIVATSIIFLVFRKSDEYNYCLKVLKKIL